MFIFIIIILLISINKINTFLNPLEGICDIYNSINFLNNSLNGSTQIILEKLYKELILTTNNIFKCRKIYLKISIISYIFLIDLAMDRNEPGRNIGFFLRQSCRNPLFIPYEAALCYLISFKRKYNDQLKEKVFGKNYKKLPEINCWQIDISKFDEILGEYQEEIWDTNYIVFFKYLINERKSLQKFLESSTSKYQIANLASIFGTLRMILLQERFPEYLIKLEDNDIQECLLDLFNKALIKGNKYQKWRIRNVIDFFIYKEWYKSLNFDEIEEEKKDDNETIKIKNKFLKWCLKPFCNKMEIKEDKNGIFLIKYIWETIFENYLEGNNFLKEFVLNFEEIEDEDIEEEMEMMK